MIVIILQAIDRTILTRETLLFCLYSGITTPTEAAAIAALYALIIAAGLYRTIRIKRFCRKYFLGRILFLKNPIFKRVSAFFGVFPFEISIKLMETVA